MFSHLRPLVFTVFAAALCATTDLTQACILEFRSTDWQVARSPLVVVAKITQVTPTVLTPEAEAIFPDSAIRPSTATLSIVKVMKGLRDIKTLKVSSGPLRSCSLIPVHAHFVKDQTLVFILSEGSEGVYELGWIGGVHELADLPAIQSSVDRCDQWRSEYLQRIGKQSPDIQRAAEKLDAQLTQAAATWPAVDPDSLTPAELLHGTTGDGPLKHAADAVLVSLKDVDSAVVQTALAFDFGRPNGWSRHLVWQDVCPRYVQTHVNEVAALERAEWLRLLQLVGGTPEQLDAYLARTVQDKETPELAFPIEPPPTPFIAMRGETLTTDFLLRSQDFDRGLLYYAYGGQPATFATLDADRLKNLIPAMSRNSNEHLKWAADAAIEQMPGEQFIDILVADFTAGNTNFLRNIQTSARQDARLAVILDHVRETLSTTRQGLFWKQLAAANCFSPACINQARGASRGPDPGGADPKELEQYHAALTEYLGAAKAYIKEAQIFFEIQSGVSTPKP